MTFYTDPAFFIVLALAIIPALILGFREKQLRLYGFVVSTVFIVLLFSKDLRSGAAFVFYLVLSFSMTFVYLRRKSAGAHAAWYPVALCAVIAPLVIYKVTAVFDGSLLGFLGISYITFKSVQVVIEIHDGLIGKMSPLDYLYFLMFFPTFTSGPILRSRPFVEDIQAVVPKAEYRDLVTRGAWLFLVGVFYKFVCSSLFSIAIWAIPKALGTEFWTLDVLGQIGSAYAYGFYLFFDFAGYSFMAMGVGACFGVHVPRNFHAPFASIDIKDFWNRWHMTLSFWLRDFIFMRVVRIIRRRKLIDSRLATSCCGYLVNMGLMGLWHGLTPDYIAYGVYHGILLSANEVFQKTSFYKKHKDQHSFKAVSWFVTLNLVIFGFALFSGQVLQG